LNEVIGLRRLGFDIMTASINSTDASIKDGEESEREEEDRTFYVKRACIQSFPRAFLCCLLFSPMGFFRGLQFTIRLGGSFIRFFYFLEALVVGDWMRRNRRKHLHVHFGSAAASVGMLTAQTFPVKLSLTIHGPDEFWNASGQYLRQKVETAAFVCCISSSAVSQLMLHTPSSQWHKLVVSRLGVDLTKFARLRSDSENVLDIQEIVSVGRLVPAKGQHILLGAFKTLVLEGRNIRLRLLGYGPLREELDETVTRYGIAQRVIFEGSAKPARVAEVLRKATLFCLPSFAEGIPVALMEAMSMQVPCVSTTISGIPELIRHEVDGVLVPPADEEALTNALRRLLDDPELRSRLGASGRKRVEAQYDLQKSLNNIRDVFVCQM
jgi:glycosyltransferase involved in cell wall biosynthesis